MIKWLLKLFKKDIDVSDSQWTLEEIERMRVMKLDNEANEALQYTHMVICYDYPHGERVTLKSQKGRL